MRIKTGDTVKLIAGKDKGKTGTVLKTLPKQDKVVVEGLNIAKKHTKPSQTKPGGIEEFPAPIHVSNVKLVDPKSGEATRVGYRFEDGKKVRFAKKSNETI
ncbi:50S ribosomal protein L24 [Aerococcaceae bacterium NML191292]|nr:50S ribosomal protein L24 [Aerococcaceae bacterium NML210727]MCW6654438.1 50S ribosomal protein L24 [Aerococcaceae bacterium NML201296]MCW6659067.1 50S ribosomal protein L24 [Aerococcaceae bacterium NML191292]MCW6660827.1 50S ribosomal protein L24 [Aerococcaceae bacterium NML201209]MCW6662400.1 50S ribosomal protein L24 [Aerococcaceae bacterium NML190073]MCW6664390.1 50S ribosomal protein L24 [Aerococcaceae bacterium NML191219]MCW6667152.1 50S ribosomal protein L24 [Aerococcaceae bacterium